MSDQLIELLRERFHGHEMDVPPGAWEQVTEQMAANSGAELRDSLQDKFQGHEVQVDPSAWANINAQIGTGAAAGTSVHAGWIAAGVAAVVLTAGLFIWNNQEDATVASIPEAPQISLIEVPPTESKQVVVNPEPIVEEEASQTAPTEAGPVTSVAPKVIKQVEENAAVVTAEPSPQNGSSEAEVPKVAEQKSDLQTPARQPVIPVTVDPNAGQEPEQDRAPVVIGSDSPSNAGTETKDETPQDTPTAPAENPQPTPEDPFSSDHANDILIPNAFSPQGDGVNDNLKIVAGEHQKADVRIFAAKTGSLVFHTNDLTNMWDGRLPNGNIAEEGYYSCVVRLTDKNGQLRTKSMVVQLFR